MPNPSPGEPLELELGDGSAPETPSAAPRAPMSERFMRGVRSRKAVFAAGVLLGGLMVGTAPGNPRPHFSGLTIRMKEAADSCSLDAEIRGAHDLDDETLAIHASDAQVINGDNLTPLQAALLGTDVTLQSRACVGTSGQFQQQTGYRPPNDLRRFPVLAWTNTAVRTRQNGAGRVESPDVTIDAIDFVAFSGPSATFTDDLGLGYVTNISPLDPRRAISGARFDLIDFRTRVDLTLSNIDVAPFSVSVVVTYRGYVELLPGNGWRLTGNDVPPGRDRLPSDPASMTAQLNDAVPEPEPTTPRF